MPPLPVQRAAPRAATRRWATLAIRLAGRCSSGQQTDSGSGAFGHWADAATAEYGDLLDVILASFGFIDFRDVAGGASVRPRPRMRSTLFMKLIVSCTQAVTPNRHNVLSERKGPEDHPLPNLPVAVWSNRPVRPCRVRIRGKPPCIVFSTRYRLTSTDGSWR
jgi:hypothetical protein